MAQAARGRVSAAASLPAEPAVVRIQVLTCSETAGHPYGFALSDDLNVVTLNPPASGCRAALPEEVAVRAEAITADGMPVMVSTNRGDAGTITVDLPPGEVQTVRLTTLSATSDAAIAISLPPGQTRSLTLIVPAPDLAQDQGSTGADQTGWNDGGAGGTLSDGNTVRSPAGWSVLVEVLLATLALVVVSGFSVHAGRRRRVIRSR